MKEIKKTNRRREKKQNEINRRDIARKRNEENEKIKDFEQIKIGNPNLKMMLI